MSKTFTQAFDEIFNPVEKEEPEPIGEVRNFMGQTVIHGPMFNSIPDGTKVYTQPLADGETPGGNPIAHIIVKDGTLLGGLWLTTQKPSDGEYEVYPCKPLKEKI